MVVLGKSVWSQGQGFYCLIQAKKKKNSPESYNALQCILHLCSNHSRLNPVGICKLLRIETERFCRYSVLVLGCPRGCKRSLLVTAFDLHIQRCSSWPALWNPLPQKHKSGFAPVHKPKYTFLAGTSRSRFQLLPSRFQREKYSCSRAEYNRKLLTLFDINITITVHAL